MALTLIAVLTALASLIRRNASTSPLPTAALPAARVTATVPSGELASPIPPTEVATTSSQVGEADEVLAALKELTSGLGEAEDEEIRGADVDEVVSRFEVIRASRSQATGNQIEMDYVVDPKQ